MDQFYSLLCNCWKGDGLDDSVDIIFNLPPEVAIIILRLLDPKALVAAILVSKRWVRLIRSDRILRKSVREELLRQREARMNIFYGIDTARAQRRSRPGGATISNTFARKNVNRVAVDDTVLGPIHQDPSVTLPDRRPGRFAGTVRHDIFAVPMQAPEMSVPCQTYNLSSNLGFDARRIKTGYPSRRRPEPEHTLSFDPLVKMSSLKASKCRPSKKNVDKCKNTRPTSLRL